MQSVQEMIKELNNEIEKAYNNEELGRYALPVAIRLIKRLLEDNPEMSKLLEE